MTAPPLPSVLFPPFPCVAPPPATKLQNVWLAEHLATLLPPNVTANAVTPGWVPGTGLGRHLAGPVLSALAGCLVGHPCHSGVPL